MDRKLSCNGSTSSTRSPKIKKYSIELKRIYLSCWYKRRFVVNKLWPKCFLSVHGRLFWRALFIIVHSVLRKLGNSDVYSFQGNCSQTKRNKRKISQLQVNRRNTTLTWSTFSVNVRLNILTDILFDEERVKP